MLNLSLDFQKRSALRVLCLGAHCDDIEIGCGGSLQVMQARSSSVAIDCVVMCSTTERQKETRTALSQLIKPTARGQWLFGQFSDGRLPSQYFEVKEFFERLKTLPRPDLILCHEREDRHQDHRIVNEMVWSTFRDHLILEYEIPKWDGGLGQPNAYVPLTAIQVKTKVKALLSAYRSQAQRDWFTEETFMAMLRLRGIECRSASGYAEAFYGRKLQVAL
jgi:LmbE family N-acetylglucosaminyl deacetylase